MASLIKRTRGLLTTYRDLLWVLQNRKLPSSREPNFPEVIKLSYESADVSFHK